MMRFRLTGWPPQTSPNAMERTGYEAVSREAKRLIRYLSRHDNLADYRKSEIDVEIEHVLALRTNGPGESVLVGE